MNGGFIFYVTNVIDCLAFVTQSYFIFSQDKDVHKRSISVARCYPMKNRFPDILPYDCSRVELPSTKDDYINASYMKVRLFKISY